MPDVAQLAAAASEPAPGDSLREAVVREDATEDREEVRCVIASLDPNLATEPLPWTPVVNAQGAFYPKQGDRAILAYPAGGPPVILQWWPAATEPDASF